MTSPPDRNPFPPVAQNDPFFTGGGDVPPPGLDDVAQPGKPRALTPGEGARRTLSYLVFAVVLLLALSSFAVAALGSANAWNQVKDDLSLVFVPLLAIAGTVVGFFFSGRSRD
jgi:hypothetical protein